MSKTCFKVDSDNESVNKHHDAGILPDIVDMELVSDSTFVDLYPT